MYRNEALLIRPISDQIGAEYIQEQALPHLAQHEQHMAQQEESTAEAQCRMVPRDRDDMLQEEQQWSNLALTTQDDLAQEVSVPTIERGLQVVLPGDGTRPRQHSSISFIG